MAALEKEKKYVSPEDVWVKIKAGFPRLGLPTIYRNLEEMAQGGLISKIAHSDRRLYYYFCGNKNHHHHFVCLNCRQVADLNVCFAAKISSQVKRKLGGVVKSHLLQVDGLCSKCKRREN